MATHTSFHEQNNTYAIDGVGFPVWIEETTLGKEKTINITSAWQLSPEELAEVIHNEGIVFVRFIGAQPLMNLLGANALQFEGENAPYGHEHAFTLSTDRRKIVRNGKPDIAITSAWQLVPEQLTYTIENGGVVFLRTVGWLPPVEVLGFNPIT
jgi:hypothetical protein